MQKELIKPEIVSMNDLCNNYGKEVLQPETL